MAKKSKKPDIQELIEQIKHDIVQQKSSGDNESYIPSIIEFVESDAYLGLSKRGIHLRPVQKLVLKIFYRGSVGNEDIELTQDELELCNEFGLDNDDTGNGNLVEKFENSSIFRELVLVWGRRSGKDFVVGIIALYEAMKLIECPGGNPYDLYNLGSAAEFTILTIANSKYQAKIAYDEIHDKLANSPYFADKYVKEGMAKEGIIHLLTFHDKDQNLEYSKKGLKQELGSIKIEVGHSESNTLLGKSCYVLIFDEIGTYKNTAGSQSGDALYNNLTPAVATYVRKIPKTDKDGKPIVDEAGNEVIENIYDGKVVCISSPRDEDGIFFKLYDKSHRVEHRLMCRLPTWKVNPIFTEADLQREFPEMSPEKFAMEFGAQFSGTAGENFFAREYVEKCFREKSLKIRAYGEPGVRYFAHLDPARSSHNYALVVAHSHQFYNEKISRKDFVVIVDHIKVWHPKEGRPIDVRMVDEYVLNLNKHFHLSLVTFDQWNSTESVRNLRRHGIPSMEKVFTTKYKMMIYDNLFNLVSGERILIPQHLLLRNEMLHLKRKYTPTGAYRVLADKDSDVNTDDVCVSLDTLVFTDNGPRTIEDVCIGDRVVTHDGTYKEITGKSIHAPKGKVIKLTPYYGFPIVCTENHPVYVLDDRGNNVWKKAGDIDIKKDMLLRLFSAYENKVESIDISKYVDQSEHKHQKCDDWNRKDKIRCKNANGKWHNKTINLDEDFGYICGLYIAEGSIGDHCVEFAGNIEEQHVICKARESSLRSFGVSTSKVRPYSGTLACQYSINSQIIKNMFIDLFGKEKAPHKYIPSFMMNTNVGFTHGLIRGMFDGDGSGNEKAITFTTTSVRLAHQIQQILLSIGAVSSISISRRKGKYSFIGERRVRYNHDLLNIRITDSSSYNTVAQILGIENRKEQSKYHHPKYEIKDDYISVSVRKIEEEKSDLVANISVKDNNSYLSGSIISHNCDALAGAAFNCVDKIVNKFPQGKTVNISVGGDGNKRVWQSMSGPIGYGTGQQVADWRKNIKSFPNRGY